MSSIAIQRADSMQHVLINDSLTEIKMEKSHTVKNPQYDGIPLLQEGIDNSRKKNNEKKTSKLNRVLLIVILFLIVILAVEILFHLLIAPRLLIENIQITTESDFPLSNRDILNIAGINEKNYYFSIDTTEIQNNLESYPLLERAVVSKEFPNILKIKLHKREPLAVSLIKTEDGTIPVVLDSEGVIFQIGTSVSDFNIPVISGIKFPQIRLGMRIPEELISFLKDMKQLKNTEPVLFNLISELKFIKKNNSSYEVLLYPADYHIPVRIGTEIDEYLLKYILMVLDVVFQQEMIDRYSEIDFRTGDIVYRTMEE